MAKKPKFDPSKPFEVAKSPLRESGTLMDAAPSGGSEAKPKFDPSKPFEAAPDEPQAGILDRAKGLFGADRDKIRQAAEDRSAADLALRKSQEASGTGLVQTELEQGANALTLGYLPQIQAAGAAAMGDDYTQARDANIKRLAAQQEAHPVPAMAGTIGGGLLNAYLMPAPTLFKGAGLVSKTAQGALTGGMMGAMMNPGDQEGVVNPIQGSERLENAKSGAALGAKIAGGAAIGQKVASGVSKLGGKLKSAAEGSAFKTSGAMLKDFRQAAGKDQLEDMGRFMLDKGIVKAGDTYETVAQKAEALNADAGKRLDDVYNKATAEFEKGGTWTAGQQSAAKTINGRPVLSGKAPPADIEMQKPSLPGFNPVKHRDELINKVKSEMGDSVETKAAVAKLSSYLDDLAEKYGDGPLPPRLQNDIKGYLDEAINYARNPLTKQPGQEKAFSSARKYLSQKIDETIKYVGERTKDPALVAKLKEANRDYGYSKQIGTIAADRVNRVSANNAFGLSDRIAGGAGAAAAAVASAAGGEHNPADIGVSALGAGLLAAGGNHLAQRYGNSVMAAGLNKAAPIAQGAGQALQAGMNVLTPEMQQALMYEQLRKKGLLKGGLMKDAAPGMLTDKDAP